MKSISKIIVFALCFAAFTFAGEPLSIGARADLNFSTVWGKDSPEKFNGLGFNAGGAMLYKINSLIGINPEVVFAMRRLNHEETELDVTTELTLVFLNLEIPVLARIEAVQGLYFEAGPQLSLNLKATAYEKQSYEDESTEDDFDIKDMTEFMEFDLVLGVGKRLPIGNGLDISFRFALGLTNLSVNDGSNLREDETKMMMFRLGATYWFM